MMACVHNAVFITFVHGFISNPKPSLFGQLHAEHALMALTCFKFRILTGPLHLPLRIPQGLWTNGMSAQISLELTGEDVLIWPE